jgi:malectin (di-glucose binding ER protein)
VSCTSKKGASITADFHGNQIRLIGHAGPFGGRAEVFIDDVKQIVPIDSWNPVGRNAQVFYYKNGLEAGEHTLKIVALGEHNPYSQGDRIYVEGVQFSAEDKACSFPTGTGPTGAQRMIFGYTSREDYRDSKGGLWRPATEVAARFGPAVDTLAAGWWTNAAEKVTGTQQPELYRYGLHGHEFRVNLTVGPGKYDLRLAFANTRGLDTQKNCFDILINGRTVAQKLDVTATAGGPNKAVDLIFKNIAPSNGVVEVFFKGYEFPEGATARHGEAFVQALEIGKNLRGESATPIASLLKP